MLLARLQALAVQINRLKKKQDQSCLCQSDAGKNILKLISVFHQTQQDHKQG